MQQITRYLLLLTLVFALGACGGSGDEASSDGASGSNEANAPTAADIGPVREVDLDATIDEALAARGKDLFDTRCKTCHRLGERYVGPDLTHTAAQRDPVYIMNMILAPEKMLQQHPTAKALLAEYGTMMTNQNLSEDEARALLEYMRQVSEDTR